MSIRELFDFQEQVLKDWVEHPRAWLLQANPVWGSWETLNWITLFDTFEMAEAYLTASLLPKTEQPENHRMKDGYLRTFRPDSLLWDYNIEVMRPMIVPTYPWYTYKEVSQNPAPPSGAIPLGPREWSPHGIAGQMDLETNLPKYGRDYDVGFGGPKANMDGAQPQAPL